MGMTALARTTQIKLTNSSGSPLNQGDVVVFDNALAQSVTVTAILRETLRTAGVVLEPNGIPAGSSGMIATGGWVPRINLIAPASIGWKIGTSNTYGRGTASHGSPAIGDFAEALSSGSTPEALLWGRQII